MISNLEYYKVFYYVATSGSISHAAKTLNVSQPAVSQSIKQLEDSLNIQLFIRTAKGIHLTKEEFPNPKIVAFFLGKRQ